MADDAMDIEDTSDSGMQSGPDSTSVGQQHQQPFPNVAISCDSSDDLDLKRVRNQVVLFLQRTTAYELVPASSKVVLLENKLPFSHALEALVANGIQGAPIWDAMSQNFVGMLTFVDVLEFLLHFCRQNTETIARNVQELTIQSWREYASVSERRPHFLSVDVNTSLYEVCMMFRKKQVHRVPIFDRDECLVLHILTYSHILRFVYEHLMSTPSQVSAWSKGNPLAKKTEIADIFFSPVYLLGIGKYNNLITMKYNDSLLSAIEVMNHAKVSAIPIIDENGALVDVFSRADISLLAYNYYELNGELTLHNVISQIREVGCTKTTCSKNETLKATLDLFVSTHKHRIYCIDEHGRFEGVITLSDIIDYFLE